MDILGPAACLSKKCFCEALRDGPLMQPVNTITSIPIVLVGLYLLFSVWKYRETLSHRMRGSAVLYGTILGLSAVIAGLGSIYLHAKFTFLGQWIDLLGMYLAILALLVHNITRLRDRTFREGMGMYIILVLLSAIFLYAVQPLRRHLFVLLAAITLVLEIIVIRVKKPKMGFTNGRMLLGSFVLMSVVWILDNTHLVCWPESLFQLHAIWHFFAALVVLLVFSYHTSEEQ